MRVRDKTAQRGRLLYSRGRILSFPSLPSIQCADAGGGRHADVTSWALHSYMTSRSRPLTEMGFSADDDDVLQLEGMPLTSCAYVVQESDGRSRTR